ncbi:MAG: N-acetyltransferase family protein [Paracoccaceae bacterium]|jgi:phosphinothricin acetyltransferase
MDIRPAQTRDIPQLVSLWNDVIYNSTAIFHSTPRTAQDVQGFIDQRGRGFLVAVRGETVLSLATYFPFRAGNGYDYTVEYSVISAPDARGSGAGRAVVEALMQEARAQGKHSIWGVVSAENEEGLAFHKALEFTQVARLPQVGRKFDRWLDAIYMQKML